MTLHTIYKQENIIKTTPEERLSHVLSLFSSSHDAAFVFDEEDQYLGVVSPYHCMIKKSYPSNAKIRHSLVHCPRIDINFPLAKVVELMYQSKIYFLPVFKEGKFFAIISARRILNSIKDCQLFKTSIGSFLEIKRRDPMVSLYESDFLSRALSLFKKYRVSKLVVIGTDMKLRGVVSYFDLISYLTIPKEKQHFSSREGNKIPQLKRQIKTVMKPHIYTLSQENMLSEVADIILTHHVGSVVVADEKYHPIGVITTTDLLQYYFLQKKQTPFEVMTKNLPRPSFGIAYAFIKQIKDRVSHLRGVQKTQLFIAKGKNKNMFSAILSIFGSARLLRRIKGEGKNLPKVLQEVKKKTKNLQQKSS